MQVHLLLIVQSLTLLAVANGTPVVAKRILGDAGSWPLDGGLVLADGQPLFGRSKTIRGVLLGTSLTTLCALLLGMDLLTGILLGAGAMAGDLTSSFAKRRLRLAPSSMAPGLDQVPESLLPLILAAGRLDLSVLDVLLGVGLFWGGELVISRWLYALKIRDRPY